MQFRTTLKTSIVAITMAMMGTLSGCSEMTTLVDDLQATTTSLLGDQSTTAVATSTNNTNMTNVPTKTTSLSKQDLVGLLGSFENSCGFDSASYREGTKENLTKKRFKAFQETFMAKRYNTNGSYTAYVEPNYRARLPAEYREAINNITVVQNNEGVKYSIDFNNATYRGYDLSRLELFYQPESDNAYSTLYFKNSNFTALKPVFKTIRDDLDELRGANFDVNSRSVVCYLGL